MSDIERDMRAAMKVITDMPPAPRVAIHHPRCAQVEWQDAKRESERDGWIMVTPMPQCSCGAAPPVHR